MQKQKSHNLPKFIITMTIILLLGTLFGVVSYYLAKDNSNSNQPTIKQIKSIELSQDKKAVLNAETKGVIFTIEEVNKFLKDSGYEYNPKIPATVKTKYGGNCFEEAALSNDKQKIVFSTSCLSRDLQEVWVGSYATSKCFCREGLDGEDICSCPDRSKIFLTGGGGKNFTWSENDKTITYEIDLGLAGMTGKRTIDSRTGEIIDSEIDSKNEVNTSDWKTYRSEEFGFEVKYPEEWTVTSPNLINNLVSFGVRNGSGVAVVSVVILSEKNIQEEIDKRKLEMKAIDKNALITESEILVNDIKAKQIKLLYQPFGSFPESLEISTYFNYRNNLYAIHLSAYKKTEQKAINIYNSFLSTFKFTDKLEKVEALLYKYDWGNENCTSFIKNGGFGASASNKRVCDKWIDFADELIYYKFDKNENLEDYFCEENKSIHSGFYYNSLSGHATSLNCSVVKSDTGYENVIRTGYLCYREPCGVMCGDLPPVESCAFRDVLIAYTNNTEFPIVAIGYNWGKGCVSKKEIEEINQLDFNAKYDELDVLMQKKYEECKIKNKDVVSEFNNYIKDFKLYKR
ncbi:hypothetical protein KAI56_01285 [Candidatus Parcubacteria bacterium]|nr:hypothetical protein [Candidatus Parcubacteria bacterium]